MQRLAAKGREANVRREPEESDFGEGGQRSSSKVQQGMQQQGASSRGPAASEAAQQQKQHQPPQQQLHRRQVFMVRIRSKGQYRAGMNRGSSTCCCIVRRGDEPDLGKPQSVVVPTKWARMHWLERSSAGVTCA